MTRPLVRKLGAPFALAYLLAGVLGAALHSHEGHEHGGHVHSHAAAHHETVCSSCHCGHHQHSSQASEANGHDADEPADEEHHCPVCENLAKPPLPVATVEFLVAVEPVSIVADPIAPVFDGRVLPVWNSRGPPVV